MDIVERLIAPGLSEHSPDADKKEAADTITSLRARCASLEAERDANAVASSAFNAVLERAERSEAMCADLAKALEPFARIAELFDNKPPPQSGDILHMWETMRGSAAVTMTACAEARATLAAYRKEPAHE